MAVIQLTPFGVVVLSLAAANTLAAVIYWLAVWRRGGWSEMADDYRRTWGQTVCSETARWVGWLLELWCGWILHWLDHRPVLDDDFPSETVYR